MTYGGGKGGYSRDDRNSFNDWKVQLRSGFKDQVQLIVENVSSRTGCQDLKDFFRPVAEVVYTEAHQGVRGEGILELHTQQDLKKTMDELDGSEQKAWKLQPFYVGSR